MLDSDDAFCDDKVEKVVAAFANNPAAVMVQHLFHEILQDSTKTGRTRVELFEPEEGYLPYIFKSHSLIGLFSQTSALSFRKAFLEKVLPISEDGYGHLAIDARLTRIALFHGKIVFLPELLALYRIHGENWINQIDDKKFKKEFVRQLYSYFNELAAANNYPPIHYYTYRVKKLLNPHYWQQKIDSLLGKKG